MCGFGGLGWLWVAVGCQWWISSFVVGFVCVCVCVCVCGGFRCVMVCCGFLSFYFFIFFIWVLWPLVVMGSIGDGFIMEVVVGSNLRWIYNGCGFQCGDWFVVDLLDLGFIDVSLVGFCGRRWLLGFVASGGGGGGGFQYGVDLQWGWFWVLMW